MYGDVLGSAGHVKIGDNVFIGMNSTILKGVTIGDNVVIGANSLINKDVPSNSVVVGNPQRVVCTIDEYLEKRRAAQLSEAADLYDCWRRNSPEGKRGGCLRRVFSQSSSGCSSRVTVAPYRIRRSMRSRRFVEPSKRVELGLPRQSLYLVTTRSLCLAWMI